MQVMSEAYVNLKRKPRPSYGAEEAWQLVSRYFQWNPLPADETLLRHAREIESRFRLSWWDSMIVAAAQLQKCSVLLTEDLHDGAAFGTLIVRSPFTLEVREPAAAYSAMPQLASLHRPRGRPRRTALA
jgi:predicted nucleic acid-binding protein